MKSRLLLEGSFFPKGNRYLDYFFHVYACIASRRAYRREQPGIRAPTDLIVRVQKPWSLH